MTPGQAAYELWRALVKAPLTWEQLPQPARDGWEDIAQAGIRAQKELDKASNPG